MSNNNNILTEILGAEKPVEGLGPVSGGAAGVAMTVGKWAAAAGALISILFLAYISLATQGVLGKETQQKTQDKLDEKNITWPLIFGSVGFSLLWLWLVVRYRPVALVSGVGALI